MEIFNNYKDFIKFIETKTKKDDDFIIKLDKLNNSILDNYKLIIDNKKDYAINDNDIQFDNENEKNKIIYYKKKFEDSNFKEIKNLLKKPQKKTGGYDKNIFETFINFIDNLTELFNKDSNIQEIYNLYQDYIINNNIDKLLINNISKNISKNELIKNIINDIPQITKDINKLKDLIIKFKNSNDISRLLLKDYPIEKDGYIYSYRIEEFIKLLNKIYEMLNIRFLEFIKKLTKELYNYDKNFFKDKNVQEQFKNGNIDKFFDFSGLSMTVNYDEIEKSLENYEKEDADKIERIAFLDKYKELFNPNNGQWKKDFEKEKDDIKKNKINEIQKRFQKLIIYYLSQESEVSDNYDEVSDFFNELKTIKSKLEKEEKLKTIL